MDKESEQLIDQNRDCAQFLVGPLDSLPAKARQAGARGGFVWIVRRALRGAQMVSLKPATGFLPAP